jgi:hypothetical protein
MSKSEPEFTKWSGALWKFIQGVPVAYCIEHKHRLDIHDAYNRDLAQDSSIVTVGHQYLICPVNGASFPINGSDFYVMRRRFVAMLESELLKGATYRDLDNIYTPVLKVSPKPKDDRYSVQVEIDDTPNGKKMVIYAMDREDPSVKAQIFIDPQNDKITFDSNDLHPNMIFSKITAYFKDGKKASMEQKD